MPLRPSTPPRGGTRESFPPSPSPMSARAVRQQAKWGALGACGPTLPFATRSPARWILTSIRLSSAEEMSSMSFRQSSFFAAAGSRAAVLAALAGFSAGLAAAGAGFASAGGTTAGMDCQRSNDG